ncbi:MAG: amylo-alpha-1,6-glucosidase [Nanoarchaeota archaeon]
MKKNILRAFNIAKRDLRKNYSEIGILAGTTHFNDLWARDAMFASLGVLELGDFGIVKKSLISLLDNQRDDGLFPNRIGINIILKFLWFGKKMQKKVSYLDDIGHSEVKDTNSLVIIIANEYVKKSGDADFAKKYFEKLKKAVKYYGDDLVEETPYANWADTIPKKGKVLYTNVLYWKAIVSLGELAKKIRRKKEWVNGKKIKEKINKIFWNNEYYNDTDSSSVFASDGNVLAIIFNLATKKQKESILQSIRKFKMEEFTLKQSHPEYEKSSMFSRIMGMGDYHNLMWLWTGCLYGLIKKEMLDKIADKINEFNGVYEIYELDGKPVARFIYKSEKNFSWSAGLFIYAVKKMYKKIL